MDTHPMKLVTIVAEPVLETRLTEELTALGATGFSVVDGRGRGSAGRHAEEIPGTNVRIEALVGRTAADRIVAHLARTYFADYGVIAYVSDVHVVRSAKYDAGAAE
jgi:nitrogen regulatory protein P-II 2